jgi:cytochrome c nitrite reductase small subunit
MIPVALVSIFLVGCVIGVGVHTFIYAKGASYMTDDPKACMNCHVMREQYDGWLKGSHRNVAVCNDCHTPAGFIGKYTTKALNGFHHSLAFTSGRFPDVIQITERNHQITENSCRKCHSEITHSIDTQARVAAAGAGQLSCVRCHSTVGHMR